MVVSRGTFSVVLTYSYLNWLGIISADIQYSYITANNTVKHFILCGPEFGFENTGRKAMVQRDPNG